MEAAISDIAFAGLAPSVYASFHNKLINLNASWQVNSMSAWSLMLHRGAYNDIADDYAIKTMRGGA